MSIWPESLVREIAERRVVFFVGSGISKAAHAALPTWSGLLTRLAAHIPVKRDQILVGQLIRQGRMLDAAQIVRDGVPPADLTSTLRSIFQLRPSPHHDLYEDLLLMDPKTLVTTNYDEFLEKNFEHFSHGADAHSVSTHTSLSLIDDLRYPIRSVVKIHGCITDPANVVLDRVSYFNARRNNQGIFVTLSALMTVNTVVFLGYSLNDPDIQLILENINMFSTSQHTHYALIEKLDHKSLRNANKHSYNTEFLEYARGAHGSVPGLIRELRVAVDGVRSMRGIV